MPIGWVPCGRWLRQGRERGGGGGSPSHERRGGGKEAGVRAAGRGGGGGLARADRRERWAAGPPRTRPRRDHRRHLRADPHPERSPAADRAAAEERGERRR